MKVKEHYDTHLGNFYSWYTGDFDKNKNDFKQFCIENDVKPLITNNAIDLGAGNGIQTLALAELGFKVTAIDFNIQLINELESRVDKYSINVINGDIRLVHKYKAIKPELIVCCGDTLPHLESTDEIKQLLEDSFDILVSNGKLILTFRDYSTALEDTNRFILVKSDSQRILTCFLEYFSDSVRVTDLLHEFENGKWVQKVSSYYKTRLTKELVITLLKNSGFEIKIDAVANRIITIISQKL